VDLRSAGGDIPWDEDSMAANIRSVISAVAAFSEETFPRIFGYVGIKYGIIPLDQHKNHG
jgi:hypothetical protein